MIDTTQLRIGNWVNLNNGTSNDDLRKVTEITNAHVTVKIKGCKLAQQTYPFGFIYGVKLTEEILLKCGFSESNKSFEMIVKNDFKLMIEFHDECVVFYKVIGYGIYTCLTYINYLHQLQNLYWCLCGKELEINL